MNFMKGKYMLILSAVLLVACGERGAAGKKNAATAGPAAEKPVVKAAVAEYGYKVVKVFPHSESHYTQGLFWHDGFLYEGTGLYGRSSLMKVDPATGRAVQTVELEKRYFGEGITWHDGRIYQLTWQEGKAFVYDGATFRLLKTFSYDGEGWGITSDGQKLYMSDGSDKITVRNPETFAVEKTLTVTRNGRSQRELNELEWIDGEIWANVYTYEEVLRIDPQTGIVKGVIDFEGIQAPSDYMPRVTDFFNGIAHDSATGNIYVTGKNWNKLYQVEVVPK